MDPLVKLIPEDDWDYVRTQSDTKSVRRTERLTVAQLTLSSQAWSYVLHRRASSLGRIEWYGRHVKSVSWCSEEDSELSRASAVELLMHLPDHIQLLPNVRSFTWTERRLPASPSNLNSKLFANSGLQSLTLTMGLAEVHPLADILDVVKIQCPRLATLQLVGDGIAPLDVAASAALADLVRSTNLIHFTCTCPLFDEVLVAVARSISLKYVAIRIAWYTLDSIVVRMLPSRCFPSVQDLELQLEILDTSSLVLLKRLTSDKVANLALHVMSEDNDDDLLMEHLDVIAKAPFASTLRKIELHAWRTGTQSDEDDSNPCTVTLNTLRPLLALKQLTHFIVHARNFSLTSQDVRTIASSLPNLDTLELMPSLVLGTEPPAEALLHLAELCSHLTLVALPITTAFGVPRMEQGWKSKSPVTMYTIVTSQDISGDPQISSYISALFPASPIEDMYTRVDPFDEFEGSHTAPSAQLWA